MESVAARRASLAILQTWVWPCVWPGPLRCRVLAARPKFWTRMVALGGTFACLGAILLCGSRGAVVGAAAVTLGAWVKTPKKVIAMFMAVLIVAGIYLVLPQASTERFRSAEHPETDETAHHRLELWKAGMRMFADNPIFGVGINNYPICATCPLLHSCLELGDVGPSQPVCPGHFRAGRAWLYTFHPDLDKLLSHELQDTQDSGAGWTGGTKEF